MLTKAYIERMKKLGITGDMTPMQAMHLGAMDDTVAELLQALKAEERSSPEEVRHQKKREKQRAAQDVDDMGFALDSREKAARAAKGRSAKGISPTPTLPRSQLEAMLHRQPKELEKKLEPFQRALQEKAGVSGYRSKQESKIRELEKRLSKPKAQELAERLVDQTSSTAKDRTKLQVHQERSAAAQKLAKITGKLKEGSPQLTEAYRRKRYQEKYHPKIEDEEDRIMAEQEQELAAQAEKEAAEEAEVNAARKAAHKAHKATDYQEWLKEEGKPDTHAAYKEFKKEKYIKPGLTLKAPLSGVGAADVGFGPKYIQEAQRMGLEAKMHEANQPYQEYEGQTVADESEEEKEALKMLRRNDPTARRRVREEEDVARRYQDIGESKAAQEASRPYMERSARHALEDYKDYKSAHEEDVIEALRSKGNKRFFKDVVPKLRAQYMASPAVRRHGGFNKQLRKLAKDHDENLTHQEAMLRHEGHERALEKSFAEKKHQADLGSTMGQFAHTDRGTNLQGIKGMEESRARQRQDVANQVSSLMLMGTTKEARKQAHLNAEHQKFKEKREHPRQALREFLDTSRGHATSSPHAQFHHTAMPTPQRPDIASTLGSGLMGAASSLMRRKKGGSLRLKRNTGGIINDAVNNAYLERSDPLDSLQRSLNRNLMTDVLERKARIRRAGGGPIERGAEKASHLALQDKMIEHANQMMAPPPASGWGDVFDAAMEGMANSPSNDFLSHAGKIHTHVRGSQRERESAHHKKQAEAMNLYGHVADSRAKESQFERQLSSHERHEKQMEALRREEIQAKRHKYENASPKLDKIDEDTLKEASKNLRNGPAMIKELDRIEDAADKISTGGWTSEGAFSSPRIQAAIGKGKQGDYDEFDKLTRDFVNKAASAFGPRAGAKILEAFTKAKVNRGMSGEGIKSILNNTRSEIMAQMKEAAQLNQAYEGHQSIKGTLNTMAEESLRDRERARPSPPKESQGREFSPGVHDISQSDVAAEMKRRGLLR